MDSDEGALDTFLEFVKKQIGAMVALVRTDLTK